MPWWERRANRTGDAASGKGVRDSTINTAAFRMGQIIGSGSLTIDTASEVLTNAGRACGQPEHEITRALRRDETGALIQGQLSPRGPEPRDEPPEPHVMASPVDSDDASSTAPLLNIVTASDVKISRVRYLWNGRVPLGSMTLMPGEEGIGKTTIGVWIIAQVTRGTLPGELLGHRRDVLVLAPEDGIEDVFTPRLKEAGADLTRVHFVKARVAADGSDLDIIVPRDLAALADVVKERNVAMVWIDSLVTTLPEELKSISYKDTATALKRISTWAEATGVAVAAPWHLNKASGGDTAIRMMDSRGFRTAARSVLLIVADPDADDGVTQGIIAVDKANASTLAAPHCASGSNRWPIPSRKWTRRPARSARLSRRAVSSSGSVTSRVTGKPSRGRCSRPVSRRTAAPPSGSASTSPSTARPHVRKCSRLARLVGSASRGSSARRDRSASTAGRRRGRTNGEIRTGSHSGPFSRSTPPTDPTDPTGAGSHELTDPIDAGQLQLGQSIQSVMGGPTGTTRHPTGERCQTCGNLLLLKNGRDECERCRLAHEQAATP
jgi:hypothetical protein